MKRLALVFVVLVSLFAQVGHAQQRDFSFAVAQKFRAQIDTTFLSAGLGDVNSFQIGLNPRPGGDRVGTSTPGLGFGYAFSNNLYVGGRLQLGFSSTDEENDGLNFEQKYFDWQVLPYGEYLFLDGPLRPFVAAQVGVGGTKLTGDVPDRHTVQFIISGGGGVHYFLAPGFSFDAMMLFEMLVGISGWFSVWP